MNPRRYPRTLQEAFGPYVDNLIHEQPPVDQPGWVAAHWIVAGLGVLAMLLVWLLG